MKIKNSTPWATEDLRKLFRKCVKESEKEYNVQVPFHKKNKHFSLDILNSSYGWRGRATLNGYWVMIKIPVRRKETQIESNEPELTFSEKQSLARLIIHEYFHTMGDMKFDRQNYKHDITNEWNVDWVKDYPIRLKQEKPKMDVQLQRYEIAIKNLRKAETRLKRAKTLYKKWLAKTNYYKKKYNSN